MKIYLATDHGGWQLKKELILFLKNQNYKPIDCGNTQLDQNDDYPDFVQNLANRLLLDPNSMGIVACRNGVGVSIASNRYKHIRCGLGLNEAHVKSARVDDNINVLALASDYFNLDSLKKMTQVFLNTPYSNLERHNRRLAKINNLNKTA
jgi:ribose 5-phosphate isomerase B